MKLTVRYDDSEATAQGDALLAALKDQSRAMAKVEQVLIGYVRGSFRDEVSPWGEAWPKLSPATLANRQRRDDFSVKMLFQSGALFDSIKGTHDSTSTTISMGEGLAHAEAHQFGNPDHLPWGHAPVSPLPARPSFPMHSRDEASFPQDWIDNVLAPISDYLGEAVRIV